MSRLYALLAVGLPCLVLGWLLSPIGATQARFADTAVSSANQFTTKASFTLALSGTVFDDVHYGGGSGRSLAAATGVGRPSARVELYNAVGALVSTTTSGTGGRYRLDKPAPGKYIVRVVNGTVSSSRTGAGPGQLPVQTFRTHGGGGTLEAAPDTVGGEDPGKADAGNGSTTLMALTTATQTAQSLTTVIVEDEGLDGIDFGFSFSTLVNTNNAGQGSLRQLLTNANALSNTGLVQVGHPAGAERAVFMLPNGTNDPGLRDRFNAFSGGLATIAPASALPVVTDPLILDATTQPGWTGDPLVELNGTSAGGGSSALRLSGGGSTVKGLLLNRFGGAGIVITGAGGNTIAGNRIGTNASGSAALTNGGDGVRITGSPNNVVGGTTPGTGNLISGNLGSGVLVEGAGATGNLVHGNTLGTNAAGTGAIANNVAGVSVTTGATGNVIGGAASGAGNLISGNARQGIVINGSATANNQVLGNTIGVNLAGSGALGNGNNGVLIEAPGTIVGGDTPGARNLISANGESGVFLNGTAANNAVVQGNVIGLNEDGSGDLGNGAYGVRIIQAPNNAIGGAATGAGNLISGNGSTGVMIFGASATDNRVLGNKIGTGASGSSGMGNGGNGVYVDSGADNVIGGMAPGAGNLISGNGGGGVYITGAALRTLVQGNGIGTDVTRLLAIGNGGTGVHIASGSNSVIGGTAGGAANVLAHNGGAGVQVQSGAGNTISANSIFSNAGLGIDLSGNAAANNGEKNDTRPNAEMDTPVFSAARLNGSTLGLSGYVGSAPEQATFGGARVQVFLAAPDGSGYGEGRTYLGTVRAGNDGNFGATLTVEGVAAGDLLSGTATDASGNTSEFAPNRTVAAAPTVLLISPADGEANFPTSTIVHVTFSEAMNQASVFFGTAPGVSAFCLYNILSSCAAGGVAGAGSWSADGTVFTFNPTTTLNASSKYEVAITTNARSSANVGLAEAHRSVFFTTAAADTSRPVVQSHWPANSETSVPVGARIILQFDESMDRLQTENAFCLSTSVNCAGTITGGAFAWSNADRTLVFTPSVSLGHSTGYRVRVCGIADACDPKARNISSEALASSPGDSSFRFTTAANGAQTARIIAPISGQHVRGSAVAITGTAGNGTPSFKEYSLQKAAGAGSACSVAITNAAGQAQTFTDATYPSGVTNGTLGAWNTTVVPDGQHFVCMTVEPDAGSSVTTRTNVIVDNTSPVAILRAPTAGNRASMLAGETLTAELGYDEQNPASYTIRVCADGSSDATCNSTKIGEHTVAGNLAGGTSIEVTETVTLSTSAADGAYDVRATVTDRAGNTGAAREIGAVVVQGSGSLSVTADRVNLAPTMSTVIRATVLDGSGNPLNSQTVSFSKDNACAGSSLSPTSDSSGVNGEYTTTLRVCDATFPYIIVSAATTVGGTTLTNSVTVYDPPLPPPPDDFSLSAGSIKLAWKPAPDDRIVGYRISLGTTSGTYDRYYDVTGSTSYTIEDVLPGTTYYLVLQSFDLLGRLSDTTREGRITLPAATATATASPTATPTPTSTPAPTATGTATPTATSTSTATPTGTATPTATASPAAPATPTPDGTGSPAAPGTATPSPLPPPTGSATATTTATPTATPSPAPTGSATATTTATPTATASPTTTSTPTATASPTSSPTPTATASAVPSQTPTATASPTPAATSTPAPSHTPSASPTP